MLWYYSVNITLYSSFSRSRIFRFNGNVLIAIVPKQFGISDCRGSERVIINESRSKGLTIPIDLISVKHWRRGKSGSIKFSIPRERTLPQLPSGRPFFTSS